MATTEDIAAENILKRAELARISRQLKTRLSQTNLKARLKEKKSHEQLHSGKSAIPSSMSSGSLSSKDFQSLPTVAATSMPSQASFSQLMAAPTTGMSQGKPPSKLQKKRSSESLDAGRTDDESESPLKRAAISQYPPSSPLYEETSSSVPSVPKTPPQQKISLNTDIYNTASTNKTQIHFSSPAQPQQSTAVASSAMQKAVLSTPKQPRDEGADLLMFLATSPSPVQYKNHNNTNIPSTPARSIKHSLQAASSQTRPTTGNALQNSNSLGLTPGTPKNRFLKTPGFNMNDYVNLFTPSPAITRTPGEMSKDVNGKLIKF